MYKNSKYFNQTWKCYRKMIKNFMASIFYIFTFRKTVKYCNPLLISSKIDKRGHLITFR